MVAALLVSGQAGAQQAGQTRQQGQVLQNQVKQGRAQAQQAQPGQQPQQRTAYRQVQGQASHADHEIASWLILCNEKEVALSQLAEKRAESKAVKDFAEKMAQGHAEFAKQLRAFAPDAPRLTAGAAQERTGARSDGQPADNTRRDPANDKPQENRPNPQGQPQQTQPQQAQHEPGQLPMAAISLQLAQRGLAACEQELKAKQGKEFDQDFMGEQLGMHLEAWNTMQVLKQYASPQLAGIINQGIEHTEQHLNQIRQIRKDLMSQTKESRTGDKQENSDTKPSEQKD